jgi:hypothetical protein
MRHKCLILGTVVLTVALLGICWAFAHPRMTIRVHVDIARQPQDGASTEAVFTVSVTNLSSRVVKLLGRVNVTYLSENGGGATDFVTLAGSGTDIGGLSPGCSDAVLLRVPEFYRGVRLHFGYTYDVDPFRKALGKALNKPWLLRPPFPARWIRWLADNGMLDGKVHAVYEETWFAPADSLRH